MNNLEEAFKALGLPSDASREEIEKRYDLLLRQARAQQRRGEVIIDEALVHRAYRAINEQHLKEASQQYYLKNYGSDEKGARTKEKIDHFFHYYKFHVIFSILALVLIIMGVNSYLDRRAENARLAALPPVDVSVMFFGEYSGNYPEFDETLLEQFPGWVRIDTEVAFVPVEPRDQYEVAMLQKSAITLMESEHDIYILDRANFERLLHLDLFVQFESLYLGANDVLADKSKVIYARTEDDNTDYAYGIDISEALTALLPGLGEEMIAIMTPYGLDNKDKALRFIKQFID